MKVGEYLTIISGEGGEMSSLQAIRVPDISNIDRVRHGEAYRRVCYIVHSLYKGDSDSWFEVGGDGATVNGVFLETSSSFVTRLRMPWGSQHFRYDARYGSSFGMLRRYVKLQPVRQQKQPRNMRLWVATELEGRQLPHAILTDDRCVHKTIDELEKEWGNLMRFFHYSYDTVVGL